MTTLLLIDDDEISRELIAALLAHSEVETILADSGEAALEILRDATALPDGILLDAQLPGIRGIELIAALRAFVHGPILLMSASPVAQELRAAADAFLLKPLDPEQILSALDFATASRASSAASLASHSAVEVIDPVTLEKLRTRMKPTALRALYHALADDLAQRLDALDLALRASDEEQVRSISHAIKGGCAMLGLASARNAASSLESAPAREHWQRDFDALLAALAALRAALASEHL